ncbi:unnamed protein product [Acidocella sp. C78]|nr:MULTISPECIES: hypothetical protein [Acetobacteraceae]CAG4903275.1 unnamed protein product [Acidocella sp. C78]
MTETLRAKMAAKAGGDVVRTACRNDLIAARRKLYAGAKAVDAALKLGTDEMIDAARPLVAAARLLPDA